MEIEWDPEKAAANFRKHGVRFAEAATVLDDPYAKTTEDNDHDEPRWITLGSDSTGTALIVVWALAGENIRLISARKASVQEKSQYER
ncbi:hypothetical protein SVA_3555 [Sulfurifustis variabilis]|uniref:BrnT family toxin n=1 Tax=Sulfurifustis variabilis TaxID=1675686 RepID=A0A1B4VD21_9GAMM|nr:BrnT family toxin [Sulfurifustis variabilis]BAU50091.1 hypothetical protein SVA_3555 [Sulfurifustis variabilis]